jgi:hypothetical protein
MAKCWVQCRSLTCWSCSLSAIQLQFTQLSLLQHMHFGVPNVPNSIRLKSYDSLHVLIPCTPSGLCCAASCLSAAGLLVGSLGMGSPWSCPPALLNKSWIDPQRSRGWGFLIHTPAGFTLGLLYRKCMQGPMCVTPCQIIYRPNSPRRCHSHHDQSPFCYVLDVCDFPVCCGSLHHAPARRLFSITFFSSYRPRPRSMRKRAIAPTMAPATITRARATRLPEGACTDVLSK